MNEFYIPVKAVFGEQTINVLNIESGLEFLADDIFNLVIENNKSLFTVNSTHLSTVLPENLSCIRTVLIDGLLWQKQTLTWLALKQVFHQLRYTKGKEFVRWIRKSLLPALVLEDCDEMNAKTIEGINSLSWFFCESDKCVDSLVSIYQPHLFSFFGIPPSIVPTQNSFCAENTVVNYKVANFEHSNVDGAMNNNSVAETSYSLAGMANQSEPELLRPYRYYLKLLKKQIVIPDYQILQTSDLAARLLRQRYLSFASIVLGFNNLNYFNLYDTFVTNCNDLLLAQELDIRKNPNFYFMLQVIEGGFFLQTLLACTLAGTICKSLSLQIKSAYINWLNYLLVNLSI